MYTHIVVAQHNCFLDAIFRILQHIIQCHMTVIVLARLHLYRYDFRTSLQQEVQLTLSLVLKIIQAPSMSMQFLSCQVLIYRPIVDVCLALENLQLDTIGLLACQQSHIILEQLKQITRLTHHQLPPKPLSRTPHSIGLTHLSRSRQEHSLLRCPIVVINPLVRFSMYHNPVFVRFSMLKNAISVRFSNFRLQTYTFSFKSNYL